MHEAKALGDIAQLTRPTEGRIMKMGSCFLLSVLLLCSLVSQAMADADPPMPTPRSSAGAPTTAEEHYNQGLKRQKEGQYAKAIEAYKRAVQLKPDFAEAYNNLGYSYRMGGDFDRAIAAYNEALRLNPNLATAHEYLGKAYLGKGMRREAEEQYRILQTLNPTMAAELLEQIRR
jgi:tetratricopeptide (TPR) repeat protein